MSFPPHPALSAVSDDPRWWGALRLCERALGGGPALYEAELADRELALWRRQAPFDSGDWLERRLASSGLDVPTLRALLGEPLPALQARLPARPAWLETLLAAFSEALGSGAHGLGASGAASAPPLLHPSLEGLPTAGFLHVCAPLFLHAQRRLTSSLRDLPHLQPLLGTSPEELTELLSADICWHLHDLVCRAMVMEPHLAASAGLAAPALGRSGLAAPALGRSGLAAPALGRSGLAGSTPEERFASFVAELAAPRRALEILAELPVLARQLVEALERWAASARELLEHLLADWPELRRRGFLGDGEPGALVAVSLGAGDTHRGGRAVAILTCASGWRLVYKPRSLAVEVAFAAILDWLNARSPLPPLRAAAALDRGDHGWVTHIDTAPCTSAAEVERFYQRQGAFVALLHVLLATDLHLENLIAAGEHPVLVDLETLLHPILPLIEIPQPDLRIAARAIGASVLRIGLLPYRSWGDADYEGIDLSGLGGGAGQLTPDRVLQWEGLGTDQMRPVRRRVAMPGAQNRPRLGELEANLLDHAAELLQGFTTTYRLLAAHKGELLAADGPLAALFAAVETRVVLRPTRTYGLLQQESLHPDLQRDSLELERFLDRLWLGAAEVRLLERVVVAERADLLAGDVPIFTTRPGSRDLWTSRGECLREAFPESGLAGARQRLLELGEADLARQRWFVEASLASLTLNADDLRWPTYPPVAPRSLSPAELRAELLAAAREVGDRLLAQAWRWGDDLAWIGLAFTEQHWGLVPLLDDLYGGVTGVVHFLAYLGEVTGDERYRDAARAACETFRQRLAHSGETIRAIGAFSGWGGILYAFTHWSALWQDAALRDEVARILERIETLLPADRQLDVVGGAAGCLVCLLALRDASARSDLATRSLDLARRCGEHLLARAQPMPVGVAWFTQIDSGEPITGFSHGGAGIAWALCRLAAATGDRRYADTALAAIRYEHTRFQAGAGNWSDPTDHSGEPSGRDTPGQHGSSQEEALSLAWCYGAPGIGLARLSCAAVLDDPLVREELDVALATTLAKGFGRNHSLCHGDLGNLDFVLQVAAARGDPALHVTAHGLASRILASVQAHGPICGVPLGVESPSLMNGLAGIGYGLLRAAAPERVPSVLTLDAPR